MIPGSNILNQAFQLIARQTVVYYQMLDRALNDVGQDVTEYAPAQTLTGSFQPVSRSLYNVYGLDLQKSYFTFYTSNKITDVQRDVSGDQLNFQGQRYQCESKVPWFGLDGWDAVLCVLIENEVITPSLFGFNSGVTTTLENTYLNFQNGNFIDGSAS